MKRILFLLIFFTLGSAHAQTAPNVGDLAIEKNSLTPFAGKEKKEEPSDEEQELQELTSQLLEATGFQTASNLYITYISIGSLADAFSKSIYPKETVVQICSQYSRFIAGNSERLNRIAAHSFLSYDDQKTLKDLQEVYSLLLLENNALKNLAEFGGKKFLQQYSDARQKAWNKLETILQIQKQ